jgi:membrane protein implicated in regulation of membrane protease activity
MGKIIRNFSLIMLINLLAFLSVWHILDLILETNPRYKIIFLVLSTISLVFLSKKFFKKALKDNKKKENNENNKINNNESK